MRIRGEIFDEGEPGHRWAISDEKRCHVRLSESPRDADQWSEIARAYFAPCNLDIKSRVRFVNDRVAYVFMQWWFQVTVDGGRTWHDWSGRRDLSGRAYDSPSLISSVSIQPDGRGTMMLNPLGMVDGKPLTLTTEDFGQQWTPERAPR